MIAFGAELAADGVRSEEALVLDSGCFLVRRKAFEAVGGFDTSLVTLRYALADLCLRMRQAGWTATFVPTAFVHENLPPSETGKTEDAEASAQFRAKHGFDYRYSCNTRPELLQHVPPLVEPHPAVLEAGCACGGNLLQIHSGHPDVELHGIELSEASAAVARQFAQVDAIDVETLDQPAWEAKFDAILMGDILEHLRDPWQTMRNMYRITRPGGRVIISVPNVMSIHIFGNMLLGGDWTYADRGILDRTHLRFFTKKTAEELVAQAGYEVTSVESQIYPIRPELQALRDKLVPLLGEGVGAENLDAYQWIVVGEKSRE